VLLVLLPALVLLWTAFPAASTLGAQEAEGFGTAPHVVPRLEAPLPWDAPWGWAGWGRIPPLPGVQSAPVYGAPPSEHTEFRLAHDDTYLYAAAWMHDRDPDGIQAVSLRRDETSFRNDWFLVSLDTFRDRQNTLLFATTPTGLRTDAAFGNDGSPPPNMAWNTFWDAAATRDRGGWYAVIRIPLSSLRFQAEGGETVMGVTLARRIARRNEMISWPAVPHEWGLFSIYKASLMREIVLRDVSPSTPIHATPYALAGLTERNRPGPGGEGALQSRTRERAPGLDLKYAPTSNLALDVALNPDFAQVEADDHRVNLTRFPLFFPERRPFFQDRAAVFQLPLGGSDRLFHSRRVGLAGGAPVRIHGGVRLVAHADGWDMGLLNMQTEDSEVAPGQNLGVVRVRRRILNQDSGAGVMATTVLERDGRRHLTWGSDALLRLSARDYLTLAWAESRERGLASTAPERALARIRWERRGIYGFGHDLEIARLGTSFEPALGFVARSGTTRLRGELSHGRRASPSSRFLGHFAAVEGSVHRGSGGGLESARWGPGWSVETKSGHALSVGVTRRVEELERSFALAPGAGVPAGRYGFTEGELRYSPAQGPLQVSASAVGGGFYDGRRLSLSASPTWSPSSHLQLSGSYEWNRVRFRVREEGLRTHIARLRGLVMVSTRTSAVGFLQYTSASNQLGWNLRFRYNPREGDDLYVVYDHSLRTARSGLDPLPPRTEARAFMVKYSRTFTLGF
jgi:hypothetical protein